MNLNTRTNVAALLLSPEPATGKGPAAKVRNPFYDTLCEPASVVFKNDIKDPGKPWSDGTVSRTLAAAIIPMGKTGAFISTARIVQKTKSDGAVSFDVQMPSSGGSFRRPMIDVSEDDNARKHLNDWSREVAALYKSWRIAQVKAGAAAITAGVSATGVGASAEDLDLLGLK